VLYLLGLSSPAEGLAATVATLQHMQIHRWHRQSRSAQTAFWTLSKKHLQKCLCTSPQTFSFSKAQIRHVLFDITGLTKVHLVSKQLRASKFRHLLKIPEKSVQKGKRNPLPLSERLKQLQSV
jgi:hypothetical protein